ncbi:triacylglycerol lipase [Oesophagostomum dentatum]|uniref:Triacylglycerol lipase n=1 Tax=Oesophagostomum dentatum TaxID=61180 RepID=A0A0B1TCN0_OESDE|nr:triacylglycerol lipase [Oesophagostomum dentatum]
MMHFSRALGAQRTTGHPLQVTGHSLGGALASLAASLILKFNIATPQQVKLVTFGQPRTGDEEFSNVQDQMCLYCFRVTHWNDMVPHIPNIGYRHHKTEVFYQKGMNPNTYKVCSENEDKACSDGIKVKASITNHINYFGQHVSSYGRQGCV